MRAALRQSSMSVAGVMMRMRLSHMHRYTIVRLSGSLAVHQSLCDFLGRAQHLDKHISSMPGDLREPRLTGASNK